MAKKNRRNHADASGADSGSPDPIESTGDAPEIPLGIWASISVPVAPSAPGKYVSRRCDSELTHTEALMSRRIQDAIEAAGVPCKSPAAVLKYLLGRICDATTKAVSDG
jgi:hypothetical protein